jgi:hypothetical protein
MLAANNKLWEELSAYPFTVEWVSDDTDRTEITATNSSTVASIHCRGDVFTETLLRRHTNIGVV